MITLKLSMKYIFPLLLCALGIQTLAWGTQDWRVWTEETARRQRIIQEQTLVENLQFVDHNNQSFNLQELSLKVNQDTVVLLDFIFTRCATVCIDMGYEFQQLANTLLNTPYDKKVYLLSISFDPEYDHSQQLQEYLDRFPSSNPNWFAVKIQHNQQLEHLLSQLGVIVIPDPQFGFIHNTAIYLLKNQRVIDIFDVGSPKKVLAQTLKELSS